MTLLMLPVAASTVHVQAHAAAPAAGAGAAFAAGHAAHLIATGLVVCSLSF
jgi:hypothetical protein